MTGLAPPVMLWCRNITAGWLSTGLLIALASPAPAHTADEVQALAERAAEHIKVVGRKQAFDDFTRPDGGFVDDDLYVFCTSDEGISLAHGGNPKLVGKNLRSLRDSRGMLATEEINRIGRKQGRGWVEYYWPNPKARTIQRKVTYVLGIDDQTVCASGYYVPDRP